MTLATPLQWPANRPRTRYRRNALFKVTLAAARDNLYDELERMGASRVTISSNARLTLSGHPAAKQPVVSDPGVAVYFTRKNEEQCVACDRWDTIGDNMRAIGLCVAAMRGMERWGTTEMVDAAFSGFAMLPERAGSTELQQRASRIVGVHTGNAYDTETVEAMYRTLARDYHPNAGGDAELWLAVDEMFDFIVRTRVVT